ncbi:response regulator [Deminuibacter soli]|uniref:Response regulator n=1 Tax=Deminuibacter soli TaxID=2291815 RepID=A0A3E1NGX7_9BACT|nr:response regulator [Deminuibacter soli]RFM27193.1 response regulator [Deminuibacter soli]
MLCLVIDDDMDDQEIFELAIRETGKNCSCLFAGSGEEGLQLLEQEPLPDYIFLDLNMPRVNGLQCLEAIRRKDNLQRVPVIIYSTSSQQVYINKAMLLGATAFITKPSSIAGLSGLLNHFFDRL